MCAGVKSILDVAATLERLETPRRRRRRLSAPDAFPGFYLADSGHDLPWRVDTPDEVAAVLAARAALGLDRGALVVANPLPEDEQLDPELHRRVLDDALAAAAAEGIAGRDVTPVPARALPRARRAGRA